MESGHGVIASSLTGSGKILSTVTMYIILQCSSTQVFYTIQAHLVHLANNPFSLNLPRTHCKCLACSSSDFEKMSSKYTMLVFVYVLCWFALTCSACVAVNYEFGYSSGIRASICPYRSCLLNSWQVDLHD